MLHNKIISNIGYIINQDVNTVKIKERLFLQINQIEFYNTQYNYF